VSERRALGQFEEAVATLLRLPAAGPEAPPGSAQVRLFRAAPRYFHYNLARWGLSQVFAFLGLGITFGFVNLLPPQLWFAKFFEAIGVAVYAIQLPISFAVVWLDFNRRWYLVTDRSLRIREGVWTVHERTMSFANVQNLEIRQGPIYRLLGLASLEVRSAGGGQAQAPGAKGKGLERDLHVAYFRGVDNAREIRDLILARLRRVRGAGLGDPDEEREQAAADLGAADRAAPDHTATEHAISARSASAADAARELLGEARALRALFERG
jgi:membrane protein YdbS with pleckstrin-like domain